MRRNLILSALFASLVLGSAWAQDAKSPAPEPKLDSVIQKGSYAIGLSLGSQLGREGVDPDVDALLAGLRDGIAGKESRIPKKELQEVMAAFERDVAARMETRKKEAAAKNLKDGKEFLAKNATRKGVTTLKSGLQYEVLADGQGAIPKATDSVRTHYKGTLLDGRVFDSSYDRGEPAEFEVGGVIKGWIEALQMMKVGSKWKLYVPAELAYGESGAGGVIGPNAVLIFEVELMDIVPPKNEPALPKQ